MLTSPDGLFVFIALLSATLLSILFINEAKNVGEGSCLGDQMRRLALAAEPLLALLLESGSMPGMQEVSTEDVQPLAANEFASLHSALQALEGTAAGADIQVSLVARSGQMLADSDRDSAGSPTERPLPMRVDSDELASMVEAVHKGKMFADKVGHQMVLVKPVRNFPSLMLVLRAEG